jgi:hypothetical protein
MRYANWFALIWIGLGIVVTWWMATNRREALENAGRIFVDDREPPAERIEAPPAPAPGS